MPLFHKVSNLCLSSTLSVRSGSLGYINDARKFWLWFYIHIVILKNWIEFLSFWMYFFFLKCCENLHFFYDDFVWNYLRQDLKIRDDLFFELWDMKTIYVSFSRNCYVFQISKLSWSIFRNLESPYCSEGVYLYLTDLIKEYT